ncbi:MAG: hypothetical protein KAH44_03410 [Oricola sp.]|nr:hypothetical protein [Oricola sp.]
MKICRSRAGAALVAAVLALVAFQTLAAAHGAAYGVEIHKHDGKVCVLSLVAHEGNKVLPASAFVLTFIVAVWRAGAVVAQTERAAIAVCAARPRGPPSF